MKKIIAVFCVLSMVILIGAYYSASAESNVSNSWQQTVLNDWLVENGKGDYINGYASGTAYHIAGVFDVNEIEDCGYTFSVENFPVIYETELQVVTGEKFVVNMVEAGTDREERCVYYIELATENNIDLVEWLDGDQILVKMYVEFWK